MLNIAELKTAYNRIYKYIRAYEWDFITVKALADLEISVYKSFPCMEEVRSRFNLLCSLIKTVSYDDIELSNALDAFNTLISDDDCIYSKLYQVTEVLL